VIIVDLVSCCCRHCRQAIVAPGQSPQLRKVEGTCVLLSPGGGLTTAFSSGLADTLESSVPGSDLVGSVSVVLG